MSKAKKRSRTRRAANSLVHQPRRRQDWNGLSAREILVLYPAWKTPPHKVLDVLLALFNKQHTAKLTCVAIASFMSCWLAGSFGKLELSKTACML